MLLTALRIVLVVSPILFYLDIFLPCFDCYDFEVRVRLRARLRSMRRVAGPQALWAVQGSGECVAWRCPNQLRSWSQAATLHEIGHLLGLGHPNLAGIERSSTCATGRTPCGPNRC